MVSGITLSKLEASCQVFNIATHKRNPQTITILKPFQSTHKDKRYFILELGRHKETTYTFELARTNVNFGSQISNANQKHNTRELFIQDNCLRN